MVDHEAITFSRFEEVPDAINGLLSVLFRYVGFWSPLCDQVISFFFDRSTVPPLVTMRMCGSCSLGFAGVSLDTVLYYGIGLWPDSYDLIRSKSSSSAFLADFLG